MGSIAANTTDATLLVETPGPGPGAGDAPARPTWVVGDRSAPEGAIATVIVQPHAIAVVAGSSVPTPGVRGWRFLFLLAGLLSSLGVAGYALGFLFVISSFEPTFGFAPGQTSMGTNWLALAQSLCLVVSAAALTPVAALFSMRRLSRNPYAAVIGLSLVVLALFLEVQESVPSIALQIYSSVLAAAPSGATLYATQVGFVRLLVTQLAGVVVVLLAFLVYGQLARAERPMAFRLVLGGLAIAALSAGLLPMSPGASLVMVAGAGLSLTPIPLVIARLAVAPVAVDVSSGAPAL